MFVYAFTHYGRRIVPPFVYVSNITINPGIKCLFRTQFSVFSDIKPEIKLLDYMIIPCSILGRTSSLFFTVIDHFTFPPAVCKNFLFTHPFNASCF